MRKSTSMLLCGIASSCVLALTGCTLEKTYGSTAVSANPYTPATVTVGDKSLVWRQNIKETALHMIKESRKACYLSMYELGDMDILQALADAHRRGVDVRLILDATEKHTLQTAIPFLQKEHIPYHLYRVKGGISHIKSLITDEQGKPQMFDELMGGMNFGPHSWDNFDASVRIQHANSDFERLFFRDWKVSAGQQEPEPRSTQFLVDRQIEPSMIQAIQGAKRSIDLECFDLSDAAFIRQLILAHQRGVNIRVLLEPREKQNKYSGRKLAQAGIQVKFYKHEGKEILHAKIASIDDGEVVYVGSANFTHQGFQVNHEGDIILRRIPQFGQSIQKSLDMEWQRSS
ncbi:phosphatidylserine/phosphatidylglycerophosphate/cardiolipin synthase family protein [Fodinisporobacter ferrooxydans]|uniref:phospholipase D n=1 Tax=Fodinisporobacter ferrooxydans TaxID=2901836 RepID=A0ABY4CJ23_9BACL|nr:phosphatidylserine/phosphatidylglycerophosphate/cardiolipin synthase family protein [Alicyclobacillaceae bacterium MYW30-H2]